MDDPFHSMFWAGITVTRLQPVCPPDTRACDRNHRLLPTLTLLCTFAEITYWMDQMMDEYAYLRSRYEAIIDHTSYLLRNSPDPHIQAKASDTKQLAEIELARLNRVTGAFRTNA